MYILALPVHRSKPIEITMLVDIKRNVILVVLIAYRHVGCIETHKVVNM